MGAELRTPLACEVCSACVKAPAQGPVLHRVLSTESPSLSQLWHVLGAPWPPRPKDLVATGTDKPSSELWAGAEQSLTVFVVGGTRF